VRRIPLIDAAGPRETHDVAELRSWGGASLALEYRAPALLMPRILDAARATTAQRRDQRRVALARAGQLFAEATLEGESPEHYASDASKASGLPRRVFVRAAAHYRGLLERVAGIIPLQRPAGACFVDELEALGSQQTSVWVPRGQVLAVLAPGNHPETHAAWLQALALGYNVVVRPASKDPFTPLRLTRALLEAGIGPGELSFVPGDHRAAEALVAHADLSLVYGGPQLAQRFAGQRRVLVRGPGRSKVFVGRDHVLSPASIQFLAECVVADGGTRCTNTSAILVDGDHEALALLLARALAETPSVSPEAAEAQLAALPLAEAERLRGEFDQARGEAPDLCRRFDTAGPVTAVSPGAAVVRPALVSCNSRHAAFGSEFGFPSVWVAPWRVEDGLAPLRGTLALCLLGADAALVRAALLEPSIRKVLTGLIPTFHSEALVPHDGALADFLFETKGFVCAPRSHEPERVPP
jgi:acyl-CoA reductase-like NAD-dependent aldehyde dehydrogenase